MGAEAVKEPTMEDILASIRKIIAEDGDADPSAPPVEAASEPAQVVQSIPVDAPAQQTNPLVRDVEAPQANSVENVEPSQERREDLSNGLRGSVDNGAHEDVADFTSKPVSPQMNSPQPTPEPAGVEKPVFATDGVDLHPAIQNAMAYMNNGENSPDPVAGGTSQVEAPQKTQLVSPDASERRTDEDRRNHPLRREADRDEAEFKGALMSPQTNHSVGSAFEDLKAQLEGGLDHEVEAMLRPMLREWLDNNLPSMVERLVRDEIERVARGD